MAAPVITHRKVSGKAQGPDLTRVYGNHWDDTHVVTGLENVDNTSDANKPVSTAQQAAINAGVASVTKTSIGLGNVDNTSDANKPLSTADTAALALKAPLASPTFTGTVNAADLTVSGTAIFTGALSASNTSVSFGAGGTGTATTVNFSGSSASQGLVIQYLKNSVLKWQTGLMVGTTDDFAWYRVGSAVFAFQVSSTDDAVSFGSTTASTSTTTGGVKVAGGLGVVGDAYLGGKVVSVSPTAGIGYATGAGGTVAQATSKATGVTLNKVGGQITMNAAALAAGTIVSFVLTDSAIAATDVLILNHISGGTPGSYSLNARCAAGSATIDVRNNTAGSLSEAIVIQFALIKGVNA